MDSKHHIDFVLENVIRPIFEKAAVKIDALQPGETLPGTKLAEMISEDMETSGTALYHTLRFLFDNYPGMVFKKGSRGGMTPIVEVKK